VLSAANYVSLCVDKELALCLELVLGKVDLMRCAQITRAVRSLAMSLCAQE
jgi:hypothetical protein